MSGECPTSHGICTVRGTKAPLAPRNIMIARVVCEQKQVRWQYNSNNNSREYCCRSSAVLDRTFHASTNNNSRPASHFRVVHPAGRPSLVCLLSVNTKSTWRDTSSLTVGIWTKLNTNVQHVSGHCWKRFSKSEVKGQGHSDAKWIAINLLSSVCSVTGRGIQIDCMDVEIDLLT